MSRSPQAFAKEVDYLAAVGGIDLVTDQRIVVVTVRIDPEVSFCPSNFVFSKAQAERLRDDLVRVLGAESLG